MLMIVLIIVLLLLERRWKIKKLLDLSKIIKCNIRSYPLIGHAYLFYGDGEKQMTAMQKFGREAISNGGMTHMWLGSKYYIFSVDAVDSEVILKKALDKDYSSNIGRSLTGNGTIFAPVHVWRPRRKNMAPSFSSKYLNSFMEVFSRQSEIMVEQMASVVSKGPVSVWDYLVALSFDSVCETTLNVQLKSQLSEEPFLKSLEECGKLMACRMLQPWLHLDVIYKLLPSYTSFVKHKNVLYNFINEVVKSKRKALKDEKKASQTGVRSILEYLIESGCPDLELREELLVIMIAATDTSAITSCFALCLLASHTDVQEKVVEELLEVFGDSYRPVTLEDLPRLKYLEAVIKETLRLYPAVPLVGRQIFTDLDLPSGITLVKGCSVLVNIWSTHRNPVYWGDDAELFRPERFFDAPPKHPSAFQPFSLGIRGCIGYRYGMMSLKTTLATFLRKYVVLRADGERINGTNIGNNPMRLSFEIMLKDLDGWRVRIEKRMKAAPIKK